MSKKEKESYRSGRHGNSMVREGPPAPKPAGRPRQNFDKSDPRYVPTRAEMEEDVSIPNATPSELAQALFGNHPRRKIH